MSTGKSTILNAPLGQKVAALGVGETTTATRSYPGVQCTYWDVPGRNDEVFYFSMEYVSFFKGLTRRLILIQATVKENSSIMKLLEEIDLDYEIVFNKFEKVDEEERNATRQQIRREVTTLGLRRARHLYFVSAKHPKTHDWVQMVDQLTSWTSLLNMIFLLLLFNAFVLLLNYTSSHPTRHVHRLDSDSSPPQAPQLINESGSVIPGQWTRSHFSPSNRRRKWTPTAPAFHRSVIAEITDRVISDYGDLLIMNIFSDHHHFQYVNSFLFIDMHVKNSIVSVTNVVLQASLNGWRIRMWRRVKARECESMRVYDCRCGHGRRRDTVVLTTSNAAQTPLSSLLKLCNYDYRSPKRFFLSSRDPNLDLLVSKNPLPS